MPFVTPNVKVRMSLVPGFNLMPNLYSGLSVSGSGSVPWPSGEKSAPYWAFTQTQLNLLGSTVPCSLQVAAKNGRKRSRNIPCGFEGTVTSPKERSFCTWEAVLGPPQQLAGSFKAQLQLPYPLDTLLLPRYPTVETSAFCLVVMVDLHSLLSLVLPGTLVTFTSKTPREVKGATWSMEQKDTRLVYRRV